MAKKKQTDRAAKKNEAGLNHFAEWEIDEAIDAFRAAIKADGDVPEYHLNLARAYVRGGDYHQAMTALGAYLRQEPDEEIASRFERMFSSALDEVEEVMIETMRQRGMSVQEIGKAIQMWLEYRITIGRRPLRTPKPELWAAALTHAVGKVNFSDRKMEDVAAIYQISKRSLREKYNALVETLDIMPADYRYYVGEENPLDKLVEAAHVLEELDRRFQEE